MPKKTAATNRKKFLAKMREQLVEMKTKLLSEINAASVSEAVVLTSNASETGWAQRLLGSADALCFPSGRISFTGPALGKHDRPQRGQMLAYYGPHADRFAFEFSPTEAAGTRSATVLPDLSTCPDCLRELFDPNNRRYRYPFTNCTHCGPRYSIIEDLPYDRARTSMRRFPMCEACLAEYGDPADRRFHAESNACANCGPKLALCYGEGRGLAE